VSVFERCLVFHDQGPPGGGRFRDERPEHFIKLSWLIDASQYEVRRGLVGGRYGDIAHIQNAAHDALLETQITNPKELYVFDLSRYDPGFYLEAILEDAVFRAYLHEPRVEKSGQQRGDTNE
jgi:hypothetical protein